MKVGLVFLVDSDVNHVLLILAIDSSLSASFGSSISYGLSALTTIITLSYLGGLPFIFAVFVLVIVYWNGKN